MEGQTKMGLNNFDLKIWKKFYGWVPNRISTRGVVEVKEARFRIYELALSRAARRQAFSTIEKVDLCFTIYGTRRRR